MIRYYLAWYWWYLQCPPFVRLRMMGMTRHSYLIIYQRWLDREPQRESYK